MRKLTIRFIIIALIIAAAFWLARLSRESAFLQDFVSGYGYPGIFVVSFISGFNLAVPVPAVSFFPLFLESGLNFWAALFFVVIGVTLADSIAYFAGRAGRYIAMPAFEKRIFARLERFRMRYFWAPLIALFLFASFAPLPNEVLVIPLGFLGYRIRHLLLPLFLGNGIFNTVSAIGLVSLFESL